MKRVIACATPCALAVLISTPLAANDGGMPNSSRLAAQLENSARRGPEGAMHQLIDNSMIAVADAKPRT